MKNQKMTTSEKNKIHKILSEKVDIPYVPEAIEKLVFDKAIEIIENLISENLPEYVYNIFRSTKRGFEKKDIDYIVNSLSEIINGVVNIPIISEETEKQIFDTLLTVVSDLLSFEKNFNELLES